MLVADEGASAGGYRSQVGRVLTFICPSKLNTSREIWGTDNHMYESPICTAAVHAGGFTPRVSGQVTIVMGSGAKSFEGMDRNGVKSSSDGPADSSYSFIKNSEPGQIQWYTTLERVPDDFHAPLTLSCPPKGNTDTSVWGTDVYTGSSTICVAAVHAGTITLNAGGRGMVILMPKQQTFDPSTRNGITTYVWKNWDFMSYGQPYRLSAGDLGSSGGGLRTIRLAGFTAAGSAPVIAPRTISLKGFQATGTAPSYRTAIPSRSRDGRSCRASRASQQAMRILLASCRTVRRLRDKHAGDCPAISRRRAPSAQRRQR